MMFPVTFPLGPWTVHGHLVMEILAYAVGFQVWRRERTRARGALPAGTTSLAIVAGCIVGAALGARFLALMEHLPAGDPAMGGKTIIGGLLGGWIGVEFAKGAVGIRTATGDAFVLPLAVAIALGRIGCFLEGIEDGTQGLPTALPWAVDFGDGVPRHPAPLYEVAFLAGFGPWMRWGLPVSLPAGAVFRLFLMGYLSLRFGLDFLKPVVPLALGLGAIQWACLGGIAAAAWSLRRMRRRAAPEGGRADG